MKRTQPSLAALPKGEAGQVRLADARRVRAGVSLWIGPALLLAAIAVLAGLLNSPAARGSSLRPIHAFAQHEAFHVVAHLVIFGLVAAIVAHRLGRRPSGVVVWFFVLCGTVLIETVQVLTVEGQITSDSVRDSLLDLFVNSWGGLLGLAAVRLGSPHWRSALPT